MGPLLFLFFSLSKRSSLFDRLKMPYAAVFF